MVLINLTKRYIDLGRASFVDRARFYFDLDLYEASSLYAIEDGFKSEPPRKMFFGFRSADIIVRDCYVKRVCPDYFDEDELGAAFELDEALGARPHFYLRDSTTTRMATWFAGKFADLINDLDSFGIDRERFVRVPKIYLRYIDWDNGDKGDLWIKAFDDNGPVALESQGEGILKRLRNWIPRLPEIGGVPQPA